jgi:cobalt-zinc-cadmium efflux system membrane fusion protein
MTRHFARFPYLGLIYGTLFGLFPLAFPVGVLAGAGHSHGNEFRDRSGANVEATSVTVDSKTARELQIQTETVRRQRLATSIRGTGQIEIPPDRQVEITNPIPGKVTELLVKPGDPVKKGQPVAILTSPELVPLRVNALEQKTLARSELAGALADLKLARENYNRTRSIFKTAAIPEGTELTNVDSSLFQSDSVLAVARNNYERQKQSARAEIESADIELSVAREQYERDQELAENGAIPTRQMRESQAKYATARAKLIQARSHPNLLQAESALKQAELDFRKELASAQNEVNRALAAVEAARGKLRLSDATYRTRLAQLGITENERGAVTIRAPIGGRVADRPVTLGHSFEDAGEKLMTIVNDDRVLVTANLHEKDSGRVKIGQVVRVKVKGLPDKTFRGTISVLGSRVRGDSRVIPVQAEIPNLRGQLKPGMFADLEILTNEKSASVIAVPESAIVEADRKNLVYVENGNAYTAIEVTIGKTYGDLVEVKTGLFAGDIVVTRRAPQLYAQSLKGDSQDTRADKPEARSAETSGERELSNLSPLWSLPAGGILAGGMFWLGSVYGVRRRQNSEPLETLTVEPRTVATVESSEKL